MSLTAREAGGIGAGCQGIESRRDTRREAGQRRNAAGPRELREPGGLHAQATRDQGAFAEEGREVGALVGIASVERRERVQAGVGHEPGARVIECVCYP